MTDSSGVLHETGDNPKIDSIKAEIGSSAERLVVTEIFR
jgi:hypothetical protein